VEAEVPADPRASRIDTNTGTVWTTQELADAERSIVALLTENAERSHPPGEVADRADRFPNLNFSDRLRRDSKAS
jgi:hypothetical protein